MKYTYEVITSDSGNQVIKRTDENGIETWIPKDLSNADYQNYLNSLKANGK
jgi:hypothetical protein